VAGNRAAAGEGGRGGQGSGAQGSSGAGGAGGAGGTAQGAGVTFYNGNGTLTSCTLSANQSLAGSGGAGGAGTTSSGAAGAPGGAASGGLFAARNAQLQSTIVAGNFAAAYPDVAGAMASGGFNLIGITNGTSGWTLSDVAGNATLPANPKLGPLQDNGGPTPTLALLVGSPALDAGSDAVLAAPARLTTDQRGQPRKSGAHVDSGAFEFQMPSPPLVTSPVRLPDGNFRFGFTNTPGLSFTLLGSADSALPTSNWAVIATATDSPPGFYQLLDSTASNAPRRFYRLRWP